MGDPILAAIRAAKISVLFSHPDGGRMAAGLQPREVTKAKNGIERSDNYLLYEREAVKAMTHAELKASLLTIGAIVIQES